eukprot:3591656-Pyramimonas_sp.AAC.1
MCWFSCVFLAPQEISPSSPPRPPGWARWSSWLRWTRWPTSLSGPHGYLDYSDLPPGSNGKSLRSKLMFAALGEAVVKFAST